MNVSPTRLRIFGAGLRAQVAVDQIAWHFKDKYIVEGYYDDKLPLDSPGPNGFPVLGTIDQGVAATPGSGADVYLAMGTYRSWRSCELFVELSVKGLKFARLIAPTAHVSPSAVIGENALIFGGVFVGSEAVVGHLFTAHGGTVVEHHCTIGNNVLLGPGVTLAGLTHIEDHCFLGSGTSTKPRTRVGVGTMTGAGSVVIADLPPGVIAAGLPAARQRDVTDSDEVPHPSFVKRLEGIWNGR
jgi:sugar O-acyltransferase (sialic acid O-acetyltransferase NeuD family)